MSNLVPRLSPQPLEKNLKLKIEKSLGTKLVNEWINNECA
jgi:hypothetical protein